ncbi:MAG: hypothetical protein PHT79_08680 [Syntrophomonadaceae bacterium]|nr:hypothetical protein [Syntrophomonadaceae bacterium]
MKEVLENYTQIQSDDLFTLWKKELMLRGQIRERHSDLILRVNTTDELHFLLRSLYFGDRKSDFWHILFNSLDVMPVITWLLNSPRWLINEFLTYLPWLIIDTHPEPSQLQFLVNIYQKDFHQAFTSIVNVIDPETCDYLLSRSANPELRSLLKERKSDLITRKKDLFYGLSIDTKKTVSYATLYGDKIELLSSAIESLHKGNISNFGAPYGVERFSLLLETCDIIFQCGLVEDCLAMLFDLYEDYQQKNRLVAIIEDEKIYKQLSKLLRKVIPIYALLLNPLNTYTLTIDIYNKYFPRFSPEPASVQYLNIYASIITGLNTSTKNIFYEILYKTETIDKYRPDEIPLLYQEEIANGVSADHLLNLQNLVEQKLFSLPHEAFICMEYIRLIIAKRLAQPEKMYISELLRQYLYMWKWIPNQLFIHQHLFEQLAPLGCEQYRNEINQVLTSVQNYNDDDKLHKELINRPELFKKRDTNARLEVLTGKLMGVLS